MTCLIEALLFIVTPTQEVSWCQCVSSPQENKTAFLREIWSQGERGREEVPESRSFLKRNFKQTANNQTTLLEDLTPSHEHITTIATVCQYISSCKALVSLAMVRRFPWQLNDLISIFTTTAYIYWYVPYVQFNSLLNRGIYQYCFERIKCYKQNYTSVSESNSNQRRPKKKGTQGHNKNTLV